MKLSDKVEGIAESPIRKFNPMAAAAERDGKTVHRLNIGQPDLATPACFMEAVRAYDPSVLAYTESQGMDELRQAISDYYHRNGQRVGADDVMITTGGSEALSMIFHALLDPGDEVVISEPFYTNYTTFIRAAGGRIRAVTALAEDGYSYVDRNRLEAAINERTRALICTTPGNPTGNILTMEDMRIIGEIAVEHDLWIVSDEVYREFCFDRRRETSFTMISELADRVIITDSISKRFSACGARIGSIVCKNKDLMNALMKLAQGRLAAATLDQVGAAALYGLPESYYEATAAEYERRRDAFYEEIRRIPRVVCQKPGGAFYMMVKLPIDDAEDFLTFMLTEFDDDGETVMFTPAEGFYVTPQLGKDEIRIAYVLQADKMRRSAQILRKGLDAYRERKGR